MDGSLWRKVVRELHADHRCVVPTLPVGAHRRPMRADADLSLSGLAKLEAEFLEALDLREVTLVGNDLGLFQVTACHYPERIARLVITSCEAFDNIPPGLPGHTVALAAKLPGGLFALVQPLRLRALRRLPLALGWMAKRPVPNAITDSWLRPLLTQRQIRRDLLKYLRHYDKRDLLAAAECLRSFDRPALVVWAAEDRVMPPHTDDSWLPCCPVRGWWRSPIVTHFSRKINLTSWLVPSASLSKTLYERARHRLPPLL